MEELPTDTGNKPSDLIVGIIVVLICAAGTYYVLSWYRVGVMVALLWLAPKSLLGVILGGFFGMFIIEAFYVGIAGMVIGFTLRLVKNEYIQHVAFFLIGFIGIYFGVKVIVDAWNTFDFKFTKQTICFIAGVFSLFPAFLMWTIAYNCAVDFVIDKPK